MSANSDNPFQSPQVLSRPPTDQSRRPYPPIPTVLGLAMWAIWLIMMTVAVVIVIAQGVFG